MQPELIQGVVNQAIEPAKPRVCGRGATPQIREHLRLPRPNPAGRVDMEVRFRPLRDWQSWSMADGAPRIIVGSRLGDAVYLALFYFEKIAAFRVCDDEVVRLFYDALGAHSAQELRWAIDAKANQLRGRTDRETTHKRQFAGHPHSFFERGVDHWLSNSQPYQDHKARIDHTKARLREQDPAVRAERERTQSAAGDAAFRQANAEAEQRRREREQLAQRTAARNARVLALLTREERELYEQQEIAAHNKQLAAVGSPPRRRDQIPDLDAHVAVRALSAWMQSGDPRYAQAKGAPA